MPYYSYLESQKQGPVQLRGTRKKTIRTWIFSQVDDIDYLLLDIEVTRGLLSNPLEALLLSNFECPPGQVGHSGTLLIPSSFRFSGQTCRPKIAS